MVNIVYQVYSHLPRRCRPYGTCRNRWGSSRCPARTRPASTAASPSCSPLGTAASRAPPDGPRVAKFEPQKIILYSGFGLFWNVIKKLYFGSHETCMAVWSTGCLRKPWEITLPPVPCNENCHFQFCKHTWSKKWALGCVNSSLQPQPAKTWDHATYRTLFFDQASIIFKSVPGHPLSDCKLWI